MKIAVITEDGASISQHFGRAPLYVVATVENGKVVNKETREKAGHHSFGGHPHTELAPGERHGYDTGSQSKHAQMAKSINDCQVLIAGGMGWGAFDSMKSHGIETIITDVLNIDEAIQLYLDKNLHNLMDKLH